MDTLTKVAAWVGFGVAVLLGISSVFGGGNLAAVGSTRNTGRQETIAWGFGGGAQIGSPSSAPVIKKLIPGTCSLIASSFSIAASTTVSMDCAVTGAVSTDIVIGMFGTTSQSAAGPGWEITRASASSTAGYDTFNITNGTGGTAVIPASIASSTQYVNIGL